VLSLAVLALLVAAATALAVTGQLTQLAGTAGCVSENGSAGSCTNGKALDGVSSVAVSPDAKSVYATSNNWDAVAVFERNATSGALTQLAGNAGCVSENGGAPFGETCTDGKALQQAQSVAVSPDGTSVYVASISRVSENRGSVAVFGRNTTSGALTQLAGTAGCVSQTGSGGECTDGMALGSPRWVAVSPDGKSVYVASGNSSAIAIFNRDTTSGALTQLGGTAGCVSEDGSGGQCADGKALGGTGSVAVSPDGKSVYATSFDAVAAFRRNTTTGGLTQLVGPAGMAGCWSESGSGGLCRDGKALEGARSVAASPDGKNVYVIAAAAVAVFSRDATNGVLSQLAGEAGCMYEGGYPGVCRTARTLVNPATGAVSPDGKSVYVASPGSDAVAVFNRNTSGGLTQLAGTAGCVALNGGAGCASGRALTDAFAVTVSPDSKNVYVGAYAHDAIAVFARETPP
jgi:DNA-binding beta-propeller fold protein YncE